MILKTKPPQGIYYNDSDGCYCNLAQVLFAEIEKLDVICAALEDNGFTALARKLLQSKDEIEDVALALKDDSDKLEGF